MSKISEVEQIAQIYQSHIIKGWERLYQIKIKKLYQLLFQYYTGDTALEMGCADGESTKYIVQHFKIIDIVDGSKSQLENIKSQYSQVNIIHSLFEDFKPDKKYDTIFMTHILEHLDNPQTILNQAYKWLNESGRVLIAIPNALSLHRLVGVKMRLLDSPYSLNEQDRLVGHKRVFDKQSMEKLICKTQFKIIKFTGLMLKPLSNRQIEQQWDDRLIDAFFEVGFDFPDYCSELIFVLEKN
jgi:2-polyprenyl-3-methyl-5-hydroxy-6-metoxy-1,4-benzoquinol methylase